jgi:hypothetical protein
VKSLTPEQLTGNGKQNPTSAQFAGAGFLLYL